METTQTTFLGYTVETVNQERRGGTVAYLLHGPRVTYRLMRQANRPDFMFALNSRGNVCQIKGNGHFTDRGGAIRTVNAY